MSLQTSRQRTTAIVANVQYKYKSNLRLLNCMLSIIPRTQSSTDNRGFGAACLHVWNVLPSSLHQDIDYEQFKRLLKTFLFGSLVDHGAF